MNRIDELINRLCPGGVEYKRMGEVGEFVRGHGLQKKDFTESGVGCIHYGQIYTYYGTFTHETKSFVHPELAKKLKKVQQGDLVIASTSENLEDVCKTVAYLGNDEIVTGGHATIFKHNQNPKYLAYLTQTDLFFDQKVKLAKGIKVIDVSARDMSKIQIPIPPLEIQNEIVSILDKFTLLEAELEAELEARKKQYEHYRNALLSFEGKNVEWKTLGEVCNLKAGKSISSYDISNTETEDHTYPCIGGNGLRGFVKTFSHDGEYPVIGRQGALCGNIFYAQGKFYATEHAVIVTSREKLLPRFLFHLLTIMNLNQYATGGAQPGLSVSKLNELKIAIPSMNEQKEIITILDKFDALVNDISIGLPAEIKARRKQYEYYRNRLLSFKKRIN